MGLVRRAERDHGVQKLAHRARAGAEENHRGKGEEVSSASCCDRLFALDFCVWALMLRKTIAEKVKKIPPPSVLTSIIRHRSACAEEYPQRKKSGNLCHVLMSIRLISVFCRLSGCPTLLRSYHHGWK